MSKEITISEPAPRTAIIMGLLTMDLLQKRVVVLGNDVELFVLLLAHYQKINCTESIFLFGFEAMCFEKRKLVKI